MTLLAIIGGLTVLYFLPIAGFIALNVGMHIVRWVFGEMK
jgi:hypothetical protein